MHSRNGDAIMREDEIQSDTIIQVREAISTRIAVTLMDDGRILLRDPEHPQFAPTQPAE